MDDGPSRRVHWYSAFLRTSSDELPRPDRPPIAALDDCAGVPSTAASRRGSEWRRKDDDHRTRLAHEWFQGCEYVNPDAIAQDELGDWNDARTVMRAARSSRRLPQDDEQARGDAGTVPVASTEFRLYVMPVVLGGGKPFLEAGLQLELEPLGVERVPQQCTLLRFRAKKA